ncbi:MAG: proline dehydrogenase family protein [Candidatus Acidiferrales bacterium]|jgi:proline dehydrogenase
MNLMRSALLKASESSWLRERAPRYRFIRRTVERFLPGESLDDALAAASRLSQSGIGTLLTHLGENVADRAEAEEVANHYLKALDRIRAAALPSEISVKLTQLGLDLDAEFCYANLEKLLRHSLESTPGRIVWIDMEHSPYVDVTLELYRRARRAHANTGVCVQAYLYRTEKDIDSLITMGAPVRLVKGAYNEPSEIAFPKKSDVDENYFHLAQRLLSPEARGAGVRAAIATHDLKLIARIRDWASSQGIARNRLEFAMLYGIQREEQLRLAREGYRVSVLVSYGSFWFPWFMRRLAERPANILFLAKNIFSA